MPLQVVVDSQIYW